MRASRAVELLNEIDDDDPEEAHILADAVLYGVAPVAVRSAYDRLRDRTAGWWYA